MATLQQEIREFIDEVTGEAHEGEPMRLRIHHAAREFAGVVGHIVKALDSEDRDEDLAALTAELEVAASTVARRLLAERPVIARVTASAIPFVVGPLLESAADYSGPVEQFIDEEILPRLEDWIETLQSFAAGLSGGPAPE